MKEGKVYLPPQVVIARRKAFGSCAFVSRARHPAVPCSTRPVEALKVKFCFLEPGTQGTTTSSSSVSQLGGSLRQPVLPNLIELSAESNVQPCCDLSEEHLPVDMVVPMSSVKQANKLYNIFTPCVYMSSYI